MPASFRVLILAIAVAATLVTPGVASAQRYRGIEPWNYVPLAPKFWEDFERKMKADDLAGAARAAVAKEGSSTGIEKAEAKVAQILVLEKAGQTVLAFQRAVEVVESAPGAMPGLMALVVAERLAREHGHELAELRRIVNIGLFSEVPQSLVPFVSYLVTLDNLGRGFVDWARKSEAGLKEDSYWGQLYLAQRLLADVAAAPDEVGLARLEAARERAAPYPRLRRMLDVQTARLMHRLKMYAKADQLYRTLAVGGRDFGRLLFERSWVRYGMRDFSISLGLLESLKAPFFSVAVDPEQYILAMLEYRDLCHYPAVRKLSKEFNGVFGKTVQDVKTGRPLERNVILMKMVAQKMPFQIAADEIARLKTERRALEKNAVGLPSAMLETETAKAEKLEKILSDRFARMAEDELLQEAERLLTINEQIKLLEYVSDLDEYRLSQRFERRTYESEKAEKHPMERLFWPFTGEYWTDEMHEYRVLVSDRCHAGRKEDR